MTKQMTIVVIGALRVNLQYQNCPTLQTGNWDVWIDLLGIETFTTLLANSADNTLMLFFFFYFTQKTGFDISHNLSPLQTICKKCQNLFSGENKKIFQYVICWKFYPKCQPLKF